MKYVMLETPCGTIRGSRERNQRVFKGIRYAAAERWKYPEVVDAWDGIYDALEYGKCCFQPRAFWDEALSENNLGYTEFRRGEKYVYGDDCLLLNIYAPLEAEGAPVVVFIHGGGFTGGCAHEKYNRFPDWPKENIVTVTLNYRLGPFGFLCLEQAEQESGHTGNYGLYDQAAALVWIRKNISAFGGDPGNVTIMGQSAGAMSVQELCIAQGLPRLFHKAVMLSGGGANPLSGGSACLDDQKVFGEMVCRELDCKNMDDLRKMDAMRILESCMRLRESWPEQKKVMRPVIDHHLIRQSVVQSMEEGSGIQIPYLMCSTSEDLAAGELHRACMDWSRSQAARGNENCYVAYFSRQLPGDDNGAFHSSDLWYWLGTFENCWRPMTPWDRELSGIMIKYLAKFARSGNPNAAGLPSWSPVHEKRGECMVLGDCKVGEQLLEDDGRVC